MARLPPLAPGHFIHHDLTIFDWQPSNTMATLPSVVPRGDPFMHTDLNTHEWQNCNFIDPWLAERNLDYITTAAQGGNLEQGVLISTNASAKATDLVPAPSVNVVNTDMVVPATDMVVPTAFLQGDGMTYSLLATDMVVPTAFLQGDGMTSYNADWPCWQYSPSPALELDSTFDYTINGTHAQDEQGTIMRISPSTFDYTINGTRAQDEKGAIMSISSNTTSTFDYTINGTHAQDEQAAIMSISGNTAANNVEVQSQPNPGDQHEEIIDFANWPCWQPPPAPANGNQEFIEKICKASWSVEDKQLTQAEDAIEKKTSAAPIALTRKPKPRRKASMRVRQPRIAILVESKLDHIPDGYKWRKYGRKGVKNCPYPRNYYRCSNNACPVKKRVERCLHNPRMLILTYEGQHNHHILAGVFGGDFACLAQTPLSLPPTILQTSPQLPIVNSMHQLQAPSMPRAFHLTKSNLGALLQHFPCFVALNSSENMITY